MIEGCETKHGFRVILEGLLSNAEAGNEARVEEYEHYKDVHAKFDFLLESYLLQVLRDVLGPAVLVLVTVSSMGPHLVFLLLLLLSLLLAFMIVTFLICL